MHIRSIIIPPAGPRTRLLPATKVVPKELLNVYDRPVLQFAIDEAIDAGAERIIVVIHQSKLAIRDYLKPDCVDFHPEVTLVWSDPRGPAHGDHSSANQQENRTEP